MKISICKIRMAKTKEENKPIAIIGPVPDGLIVMNEQDDILFSSIVYKTMVKNQIIIDELSCPECGYILDYHYCNCKYCGFDYCPF